MQTTFALHVLCLRVYVRVRVYASPQQLRHVSIANMSAPDVEAVDAISKRAVNARSPHRVRAKCRLQKQQQQNTHHT